MGLVLRERERRHGVLPHHHYLLLLGSAASPSPVKPPPAAGCFRFEGYQSSRSRKREPALRDGADSILCTWLQRSTLGRRAEGSQWRFSSRSSDARFSDS